MALKVWENGGKRYVGMEGEIRSAGDANYNNTVENKIIVMMDVENILENIILPTLTHASEMQKWNEVKMV